MGSGGARTPFRGLSQALGDVHPTAEPEQEQLAKESDKHCGERCASPERDRHDEEGCTFPERGKFGVPRCASPERRFECEGWCREAMSEKAAFDHPDVVCWVFSTIPLSFRVCSPGF